MDVALDKSLNSIHLESISKTFTEGNKSLQILQDVNITLPPGKFIALLGKSGSGKSTLLNMVSGIDLPDAGDIRIGDVVINKLSETQRTLFRRNNMGVVFQFFNLIPTLTVIENVALCRELNRFSKRESQKFALEILEKVGLAERSAVFPDKLSGGEQQRVALARALVHNPDVIIADEPTGNLDIETGQIVLQLLVKLIRESGKTLLMATHSQDVVKVADIVYRIKNGKLELVEKKGGE